MLIIPHTMSADVVIVGSGRCGWASLVLSKGINAAFGVGGKHPSFDKFRYRKYKYSYVSSRKEQAGRHDWWLTIFNRSLRHISRRLRANLLSSIRLIDTACREALQVMELLSTKSNLAWGVSCSATGRTSQPQTVPLLVRVHMYRCKPGPLFR